ncbi:ABC transporter permease [Massilia endophytica]|uniref:ABC transporter permease n=1 Tax=Massilia endophytica TaxID=2899220 RepID=UPI001E484614|nr:ABC transporter permease [Massilia endophytica]UGQ47061.1 ABC transporter permease subunit [Massilia endophytica]
MKPVFWVVMAKELRETLRDRRAVGMLAMFVLLYPLLVGGILQQQIHKALKPEREGIQLTVIGAAQAPTLMAQLKQANITITESKAMPEEEIAELLRKQKVAAVLGISDEFTENYRSMRPARVDLWYDSSSENRRRIDDIEHVLQNYSTTIASARLLAHGVSPVTLAPVRLQKFDTGTSAARSASVIGGMLGMFFVPAFFFALSTALDSTAGERERRSLEVLLAQPARPLDLIAGKWLAAAALALAGLVLELCIAHGTLKWLPLEEIGMSWRMSWIDLAAVCAASVSLPLLASAILIALAINAKSFKEAQTTASFALLIPMIPVIVVPMLNLNTANWMYLVPVMGHQNLLRELAKGQAVGPLPFVLTFASSLALALAFVWFTERRMKSERYMMSV